MVDGQDVGAGGGKHAQNAGKRAGHILQQGVKRNDMLRLHIVEGLHRVLVLIEGAAADAGHFCGCAHRVRLAGLHHPLGLRHPDKDLRQGLRRHQIILDFSRHIVHLLRSFVFGWFYSISFPNSLQPKTAKIPLWDLEKFR